MRITTLFTRSFFGHAAGWYVSLAMVAAVIALVAATGSPSWAADIEDHFDEENNLDLTGTFTISGWSPDSSTYDGTAKLEKWKTFTTQRGNVLQTFKVKVSWGETTCNGLAVFDGLRLYVATGEGDKKDYYLMLLSELQLSPENREALFNYWNLNWGPDSKSGENYKWKGKVPWFGHLELADVAYGYWFFMDGAWGAASVRKCGWPPSGDSAAYALRELKKDGEQIDELKMWTEFAGMEFRPVGANGDNYEMDTHFYQKSEDDYWGIGMLVRDELMGYETLVAMMGGPSAAWIGCYNINSRERKFTGEWFGRGGTERGTEEWAIPDEVTQHNPTWFK